MSKHQKPVGREGQTDSRGARIGRTRARIEVAEEKTAKRLTGRCSFFCGDERCPGACPGR